MTPPLVATATIDPPEIRKTNEERDAVEFDFDGAERQALTQAPAARGRFEEFARSRDRVLRNQLVEENLGLAARLARRFSGRSEPYEDLRQVAFVALVHAVDRYDPGRGVEFSTFAARTILGELKRYFRDKGWSVRAPRRVQDLYLQLGDTINLLAQQLQRSPTIGEIGEALNADDEAVLEALDAAHAYRSGSLDAPGPAGDTLADHLGEDDDQFGRAEHRAMLMPALERLGARERDIIRLRFVDGLTQAQIASHVGISQMHVSRLLTKSMAFLRATLAEAS